MFSRSRMLNAVVVCFIALFTAGIVQAQDTIILDFEGGGLDDWEIVEDVDLGDAGPSSWEVRDSQFGLDGKALYQGSNIWGDTTDSCLMGTMAIYKGQKFTNFTLDIDVYAADNDGMGLVWAYKDLDKHYRVIMINDVWPDTAFDGVNGPFLKMSKRVADEEPFYNMMEVEKGGYKPYKEGALLHWTLEVANGSFNFIREDGLEISAKDQEFKEGYIGIQLYAQQAEFDNITINFSAAVEPAEKMATAWGAIKEHP